MFLIHFCHICILHSTQLARVVPGRSLLILLPPGLVLSQLDGDALFSKVRVALGDVCTGYCMKSAFEFRLEFVPS